MQNLASCNRLEHGAFQDVYQQIPTNQRRCLINLYTNWSKSKPFLGRKVLLNCHLTLSTLLMVDVLQAAGAEIETMTTSNLSMHDDCLKLLKKANIPHYRSISEIPNVKKHRFYDVTFDCGAELVHEITPICGSVELTHTSGHHYTNSTFPTITIDASTVKQLETTLGTGDGLTRALQHHLQMKKQQPVSLSDYLNNDILVIFGYGKVGSGIVHSLLNNNVALKQIVIVEADREKCQRIKKNGFHSLHIEDENNTIKETLKQAICVITATGTPSIMSPQYTPTDFRKNALLINMGSYDEWGDNFSKDQVLNQKKTFNFTLNFPTQVCFLDPIFSLLLKAGATLLTEKFQPGLHITPTNLDSQVLSEWKMHYPNLANNLLIHEK